MFFSGLQIFLEHVLLSPCPAQHQSFIFSCKQQQTVLFYFFCTNYLLCSCMLCQVRPTVISTYSSSYINYLLPFITLDFSNPVTQLCVFVSFCLESQMVVTDLSENNKRADALATLGLYFGIGMTTGSLLGGTLSTCFGYVCVNYIQKTTFTIHFNRNTCTPAHLYNY